MWRDAFPWPLNILQVNIHRPEGSLPKPIFLPMRFPVERDAVPPYVS